MAQWRGSAAPVSKPAGDVLKGRGMGFAKYKNLAVYCAVIVDVAVDAGSGAIRVERAWSAADAGLVINPDGLRNQIEGPPSGYAPRCARASDSCLTSSMVRSGACG